MNNRKKDFWFWLPRVLGILFTGFVSLFALDIFGEGYSFWETLLGLLIHLVPSIVLALALVLSWRWEWMGTLGFMSFTAWYLIVMRSIDVIGALLLALLPALIGLLFLVSWILHRRASRIE